MVMKKLNSYRVDSVQDLIVIEYVDNIGKVKTIIKPIVDVLEKASISTKVQQFLNDDIAVPLSKDTVRFIKVEKGSFAISGESLPLKLQIINDLSAENKAIYDAFDAFITSYTGQPITSLSSKLGIGEVDINGEVYNSESTPSYDELYTASNSTMRNATLMGISIFNA
jgi:hypothetical protein